MIAEVDQLTGDDNAQSCSETWLIGDVLQNEIDLGLRSRVDYATIRRTKHRHDCLKQARHVRAPGCRDVVHWSNNRPVTNVCNDIAADTANATIAKQVALADEAYELGRYGTLHRDTGRPIYTEVGRRTTIAPLSITSTSLQQSHSAKMCRSRSRAFDLYQSIGDDTGSLMSLLGRANASMRAQAKNMKMSSSEQGRRKYRNAAVHPGPARSPLAKI